MAQKLGDVAVGTVLKLNENGSPQNYIVVHQGIPSSMYDASCNGTWLLRQNIYYESLWNAYGYNDFISNSGVNYIVNYELIQIFSPEIQSVIKTVKIPYCVGGGSSQVNSGANGYSCQLFLLSGYEIGLTSAGTSFGKLPADGSKLSYFLSGIGSSAESKRVANYNGIPDQWWLRSPDTNNTTRAWYLYATGSATYGEVTHSYGVRPAMVMPTDLIVDDNGNITANTMPNPPSSITVPTSPVPAGSSIPVSWSPVSGATYKLQRSVDGGSWTDIWSGSETSYYDTAGVWNTVKYRVASVSKGFTSGYTTSSDVTILPYTITSFTVPSQVMSGQNIPISWSQVQAANTYVLERKVDSGEWTQIYKGSDTSFTDSTGSWSTVQYRVKAGANEVYGSYKESSVVPVISASALVISGTDGDLGTLNKDVHYTVSSDTGNPITLERYVNGNLVTKITVQSGFAYSVPVLELPTGTGTIKLVCSVNTSSGGPVTATRIWGYTKAVVSFPNEGAPAVMTKEGKIAFPISLAECIKVPVNFGGSLDKALELIFPLLNTAVMETGSYEGTGTFGPSNPNKLTFDFNVEIVIISGSDGSLTISNKEPSGGQSDGYIEGQEVTWYSTSAAKQFNVQGEIYSYWAVGKAVS